MIRRLFGVVASSIAAVAMFLALGSPVSAAAITDSPASIPVGGTVTMSGDVLVNGSPGCAVPGTVTLISPAFEGLGEFAGVGAVNLPVDASGHFSAPVKVLPAVPPGVYGISGRCGGGNLGVTASLRVTGTPTKSTGLAHTGAGAGRRDLSQVMLLGFALIGIGAVLVTLSRPRFWPGHRD